MIALPTSDRPGVLAELGQTCGSDVGAYVEAVHAFADAGAWGVKVQMIDPERLASPDARPYWSTSRYADGQAESFALAGVVPHDGWGRVREACAEAGVAFVATPFDLGALDPLADLDPDAVKIASGDITYRQLIEGCAERFGRLILSTGASHEWEVKRALGWVRDSRSPGLPAFYGNVMPLACSLEYPCPVGHARLSRVAVLAGLTGLPVGYSDHTVQTTWEWAALAGAAVGGVGAVLAEKHVAPFAAKGKVPDLDMAMTPDLLSEYVAGMRYGAEMRGTGWTFVPCPDEQAARVGARRAVYVTAPLEAGHVITGADLACLRPCPPGSADPSAVEWLIGCTLAGDVTPGQVTDWHLDAATSTVAVETGR